MTYPILLSKGISTEVRPSPCVCPDWPTFWTCLREMSMGGNVEFAYSEIRIGDEHFEGKATLTPSDIENERKDKFVLKIEK